MAHAKVYAVRIRLFEKLFDTRFGRDMHGNAWKCHI